jgi:hypothetical protein
MNCKPGDLAIVVPPSRNAGRILSVVGPQKRPHFSGLFSWVCVSEGAPLVGPRGEMRIGQIPDAWLRPISGLPLDEETRDEVTA